MDFRFTIETYLKELSLNPKIDLINNILSFLSDNIRTENAIGNELLIAKLFCRSIESLDQNSKLDIKTQNNIISAFDNIKTIANNENDNGELMCIYLLNLVNSQRGQIELEEFTNEKFALLLDNLEKIRIIFKLYNENEMAYFPIGGLLFRLINSESLFDEIQNVKSIQALMLALQIFDKKQYPKELSDIKQLIEGKNLKFIDYLFDNCERIGDDDWKDNFEKNGLLILYNSSKNKVLIRNNKRSYFKNLQDIDKIYGSLELKEEHNSVNNTIAYFIEYTINDFKNICLEHELSQENNLESVEKILDIIYYKKNYNIFFKQALIKLDQDIIPINPFGKNDEYIVVNGEYSIQKEDFATDQLKKYSLLNIFGEGLNYINLGFIILLENIYSIPFKKFDIGKSATTMNQVLSNWINCCNYNDKFDSFNKFLKEYENQIKYICNKTNLLNKEYNGESLIPMLIPSEILNNLEFDKRIINNSLCTCNIESDFDIGVIIKDSTGKIIGNNYDIVDISGEESELSDGKIYSIIDNENHKLYIGKEVDLYFRLNNKLADLNAPLPLDAFKVVNEQHIRKIAKQMNCFKEGFDYIHQNIPMESIARYRIIHHIILLQFTAEDVSKWLILLNKHEIINYSIIKDKSPITDENGTLYVPKDRGSAQSTLKRINAKYFYNPLKRETIDLYDQKIILKNGKYYVHDSEITKIVFLFDLIQNGTSTKNTLNYYLKSKKEDKKHVNYFYNNKNIYVSDIIEKNNCSIEIYSIYASELGLNNIKKFFRDYYPDLQVNVLDSIKTIYSQVTQDDVDTINKLYPKKLRGDICPECYFVIREFNQPKKNIMNKKLLNLKKVSALWGIRKEL